MVARKIRDRLQHALRRFSASRDGTAVVMFALILVPVIGAVGVAVDYSRANSARTAMQAMIDSTALMLAKEADSLTPNELDSRAQSIFKALYERPEALRVKIKPTFDSTTGRLTVTGSGMVKTTFAQVLGMPSMNISTMTQVIVGGTKLEIALVLDNTGSMSSSGKIGALIAASKMFIDEMEKAGRKPGDIKISVIPFDTNVNIGSMYKTAPWIDFSLMDPTAPPSTEWTQNGSTSWGSGAHDDWGDADDTTPKHWDPSGAQPNWNGCVIDRVQPHDVNDSAPTRDPATWYAAENCALGPLLPLTSDFNLARATLDKMKASGKTNLTIGLVWGWHALTPGVPLTEAAPPSKTIVKYLVFLTDGKNTQNRWSTNAKEIDARTKIVCDNIKKADINIYTIRVVEGNEALLKSCASSASMYFNVTAASEIMAVFKNIAKDLTALRIAR